MSCCVSFPSFSFFLLPFLLFPSPPFSFLPLPSLSFSFLLLPSPSFSFLLLPSPSFSFLLLPSPNFKVYANTVLSLYRVNGDQSCVFVE